ncbi:prolipoprotein diacylglyceryl transferase [Galbibacter sp. EGI 63066]|uniref:prolipoprotein diacylglyceryl transferase n=1 Tax=Galbibacter sp. EGI 63066 TaxID=2993559 RepID=UPI002248DF9C|nr:prolipoprotein diacylglyceryl transferase family protein [Galbibacter sp. EGI 63066]MCX2681148.1 prolipoprotein diacylglyceryl transferase [Galbibacter sp. EGI 63066]
MFISLPFEAKIFGVHINVHLVLEYLAFFVAFRYYLYLRKNTRDAINTNNRLSIILGAAIGAFIGSRLVGFLENPVFNTSLRGFIDLLNTKTIMGGLFGGLLGVETAKKIIGEKKSSGDLFVLPIILGIFMGRIGCFLAGVNEFTYGIETTSFVGMDLGDGIMRHPLALYELLFLIIIFILLYRLRKSGKLRDGILFQYFMLLYFGFRFFMEFLKPNIFFTFGLSSIQILCIICFIYYRKTLKTFFYAY